MENDFGNNDDTFGLSDEDESLIIKYLEGNADENEKVIVKDRLANDHNFSKLFAVHANTMSGLYELLNPPEDNTGNSVNDQGTKSGFWKIKIAAIILIVFISLLATFVFFSSNENEGQTKNHVYADLTTLENTLDSLFSSNFQLAESGISTYRNGTDTSSNDFNLFEVKFRKAYSEKDFKSAIQIFREKSPEIGSSAFNRNGVLYANCLIVEKDFKGAESILMEMMNNSNPDFHRASWYMALISLKIYPDNLGKSRIHLKNLLTHYKKYNKEKAVELLAILEQLN